MKFVVLCVSRWTIDQSLPTGEENYNVSCLTSRMNVYPGLGLSLCVCVCVCVCVLTHCRPSVEGEERRRRVAVQNYNPRPAWKPTGPSSRRELSVVPPPCGLL